MRAILLAAAAAIAGPAAAQEGERVTVTGEIVDTWCYFSGVMGGPDAVVGTAHHTCALWCSAGGIPVGLLTPEGEMYMILKVPGDEGAAGGDTQLTLASNTVTAEGMLYERDGLRYVTVESVVEDRGVTDMSHLDNGVVPGFAIPEEARP